MTANYAYVYVLGLLAVFSWIMQPAAPTVKKGTQPVKKVIQMADKEMQPATTPMEKSSEKPKKVMETTEKAAQTYDIATPFEKLTQKFENGQVFHANFSHQYVDSYTGDHSTQSGEIWIGDEEYKIDSATQRVAVNGKISRVYDSNRGRLIISNYVPEEDDFAPSRILNGVDSTYTVVDEEQKGSEYFIKLRSDDPFAMFQDVEITLNENDIPIKIFVRDPGDNEITTTFSGGSFISRNATMFDLNYPDSAEVIDMRN